MKARMVDTDTLSFILRGQEPVLTKSRAYVRDYGKLAISVLTCYEILRGLIYAGATTKLTAFETFLRANHVFTLDLAVCRKAAEIHATLRQKGMLLEDADLLIASTAIVNECVLVTHNVAHYERVPGIELEDWMKEN